MATEYFDEWRLADKIASAAEAIVLAKSLGAIEGTAELPSDDEIAHAKYLRGVANDLFRIAMEEMKRKANQFKRH